MKDNMTLKLYKNKAEGIFRRIFETFWAHEHENGDPDAETPYNAYCNDGKILNDIVELINTQTVLTNTTDSPAYQQLQSRLDKLEEALKQIQKLISDDNVEDPFYEIELVLDSAGLTQKQ